MNGPTTQGSLAIPAEVLSKVDIETAVDALILHTANSRCSDLFLLTEQNEVTVSARRLGEIQKIATVSRERGRHMIGHIKALAGMDILEPRRPQDGRWLHVVGDRTLDIRINVIHTVHGLDMALRVWDRDATLLALDTLGLEPSVFHTLTALLKRPSGLMLVTGPTGTGKTTTLYACLNYLNDGKRKINTLEDPVEYTIPGVRQAEVSERNDLGFNRLLRNVLRQSPDVILIGEVRDEDTAATAVRAANSGHLVLASMHAPVAASAIHSMLALGVNPYFLSGCMLAIVAQRLIRTLCQECRVQYDMSEAPQTFREIEDLLKPGEGQAIYGPGGCDVCFGTGYAGRTGVFEVMTMNRELRDLIAHARPRQEIEAAAIRSGMIEFSRSGLLKVAQGVTSTEDLLHDIPAEFLGIEE
jgi:type II secretory ATPase GspE/PulE/Tfp pilus assembly ATPase PilB-like protein